METLQLRKLGLGLTTRVLCYSVPDVMDAFVEHWVRLTVHSMSGPLFQSVINEEGKQTTRVHSNHPQGHGKIEKRKTQRAETEATTHILILQPI